MNLGQKEALPINIRPPCDFLPLGSEFTIAGVKIIGPGRFVNNCVPGEETTFVASLRPSVFCLNGAVFGEQK